MLEQRMQARFLNANWQFFRAGKSNNELVKLAKAVFLLLGAGCFAEAEALAKTDDTIGAVWALSLM